MVAELDLPNAGPGPDPLSLSALAARDLDAVVVVFVRDYLAGHCRRYVRDLADRYEAFQAADAEVVVVLPEPRDRAAEWADTDDLPFPVLADPDHEAADAWGQPTRFGPLGRIDLVGRMPAAFVLDVTTDPPAQVFARRGTSFGDYPAIDVLLSNAEAC